MSMIGHKEWRFIVYIVPIVNIIASMGLNALELSINNTKDSSQKRKLRKTESHSTLANQNTSSIRKRGSSAPIIPPLSKLNPSYFSHFPRRCKHLNQNRTVKKAILYGIRLLCCISLIASFLMLYVSSFNYPGAQALTTLHDSLQPGEPCRVHIDNFAGVPFSYLAINGVTLFQTIPECTYDKTEAQVNTGMNFTHLISSTLVDGYTTLSEISQYDGIQIRMENMHKLEFCFNGTTDVTHCISETGATLIKLKKVLYILKRIE